MPGQTTRARDGILSVPGFTRLWLCSTADAWAVFLLPVAVTLAVMHRGEGATALGLVLGAKTLGFVLATVPGGLAADRRHRPGTMSAACLARAVSSTALIVVLDNTTWLVAALVFVVGAGEGVLRPSYQAAIGDLVPEPRRQAANALSTISFRLALVLSPGVATALTLWWGPKSVLVIAAALWLGAAYAVRGLPRSPLRDRVPESLLRQFRVGVRAARRQRWFVAGLTLLTLVVGIGEATQMVLLPVTSRDRFGADSVYAVALTLFAAGALAGGMTMLRWHPRLPGLVAVTGIAFYAGIPFALAFSTTAWPVFTAHFLAGFGMEVFNVLWFGAIQREFAPDVRARIASLDFLFSYSLSPLALVVLPVAVAGAGIQPVLICTGTVAVIACLATLAIPGMTGFRRIRPTL